MTPLEEFMQAVLVAPPDRREDALRVLRGEARIAEVEAPAAPSPVEPFLTLREVAKRLGLSPCTLWRWQIPGRDLGGRRRFKLSEVAAYLEGEEFQRRGAALRAERQLSAKGASKRPTPTTANL